MIRTIEEYKGEPCLIFDTELTVASGLELGDWVEIKVASDGTVTVSPVIQPDA